ncbi:MAG TPA: phage protein GemA/Gp16 family protein [Chitinivibrionales bacterium]|nr:phage protein GemA/Gp16 family protein [Chitinivibrionales bacterium]
MATRAQIKKIHALKSVLNLDEDNYRTMLSSFIMPDGTPVWSSKDLTFDQASSLIAALEHSIDHSPSLQKRLYASAKQLRLIAVLWKRITRANDEEGASNTLHAFLRHRFHVRRFDRIPKKQIGKVIKSLRIMTEHRPAP